ncbi:hypothetical protein [Streptomyces sp. 8K308]|nr:hypothetical protein [Streptomyces sp. 8K308]
MYSGTARIAASAFCTSSARPHPAETTGFLGDAWQTLIERLVR